MICLLYLCDLLSQDAKSGISMQMELLGLRAIRYEAAETQIAVAPSITLLSRLMHLPFALHSTSNALRADEVIGIDLGTTNSCVAVMEGKVGTDFCNY
jgi:hypothetical protein